jgi:hypothetical protein
MWLIVVQVALCALLVLFLRTCVMLWHEGELRRFPRILVALIILLSFVPVFGIILFVIVVVYILASIKGIELRDNWFTRFWIKY